jgi:hypothetical protein
MRGQQGSQSRGEGGPAAEPSRPMHAVPGPVTGHDLCGFCRCSEVLQLGSSGREIGGWEGQ